MLAVEWWMHIKGISVEAALQPPPWKADAAHEALELRIWVWKI